MITESTTTTFRHLITTAIDETGITKDAIAEEIGCDVATLYRWLKLTSISKPKASALVRAINKLAMYRVIDEAEAMQALGYEVEGRVMDTTTIASILDNLAYLPEPVLDDLLEQVKALRRKYER